jgi:hypothetical protein
MDLQARLKRHLELMSECHEWALKAKAADQAGQHVQRHFKRAEKCLNEAKALEVGRTRG